MNIKKILLFFIFLAILSVPDRPVFSQGVAWDSPSIAFPESGNETQIFDEGNGPGEMEKRKSPLIFDGVGQAINFGVGQAISGGTSGNAQIMFGPKGIVISSLAGPVSLNTKGLVLKDYGVVPTAVAGGIALINNELKFNTNGTIDGWKLPAGEGIWENKNFPEGFYFKYVTDDKNSMNFSLYHATQLNCDTNPNTRDCGDFVSQDQADGGYDKFTVGGVENLTVYEYRKEVKGGISYTGNGSGYSYDKHDKKVNSFSILNYKIFWTKLGCDTSDELRECGDFYAQTVDRQGGYDVFKKDGDKYVAEYSHNFSTKVSIGTDARAKDLIVNGSIKVNGKLSFSPEIIYKSDVIEAKVYALKKEVEPIKSLEIKDKTGKTDFSFCAIGYELIQSDYSPGGGCSVLYDGDKKVWVLTAKIARNNTLIRCGAICF